MTFPYDLLVKDYINLLREFHVEVIGFMQIDYVSVERSKKMHLRDDRIIEYIGTALIVSDVNTS
jgi:hypothetical protein